MKLLRRILGLMVMAMAVLGCWNPAPGPSAPVPTDYISATIGTLKYVPAGTFQRDATTTNTSTVSAFRMSEKEITRAQFVAMLGTDPSTALYSSGTGDPVQNVNWYHAIAFCNKLSMTEGLAPVYTIGGSTDPADWGPVPSIDYDSTWDAATANWANNGYRLPTEMEWEWAAMGATSGSGYAGPTYLTGYGKLFAGSDSTAADGSGGTRVIEDYAWYWVDANSITTHPAGTRLPNELGLYDMSGNVDEWNWDWYAASYPSGTVTSDSTEGRGAVPGTRRVLRGGDWNASSSYLTSAYRNFYRPYNRLNSIGFRVVAP